MKKTSLIVLASVVILGGGISYALSLQQKKANLMHQAKLITVKILIDQDRWGSGFIFQKDHTVYQVITNQHVLSRSDRVRIQTFDGRVYPAIVNQDIDFGKHDLALVEFESPRINYEVADLAESDPLVLGERVLASGFPFDTSGKSLVLTFGHIAQVLDQSFDGGYQVGYTNEVRKGMSGGPLLNFNGEVIAINGIHAFPLWEASYIYDDGTIPDNELQEKMTRVSWGIKVNNITPNL